MRREFCFAQKAFVTHKDHLLLVRKSAEDPDQPGKWEVPGGRMNFGEDVDQHLIREVKEEVGVDVIPGRPFYIWQWQLDRPNREGEIVRIQIVAVARLCTPTSFELTAERQVEEDYISEVRWVPIDQVCEFDLIPNMIPVVRCFMVHVSSGWHVLHE